VPTYTVIVEADATHGREVVAFFAEEPPEIGVILPDATTADGASVLVTNVLRSIDPSSDAVMIEARRSEPAE
jgi:hypothetical protein